MAISFHVKHSQFKLKERTRIKNWVNRAIGEENFSPGPVNFVFVSNQEILEINKTYLNHDYYTDIITFDYVDGNRIAGDIFISVDTVEENSEIFSTTFDLELLRVIIHGILHLCGYKDGSEVEQSVMREKEDYYLEVYLSS